MTGDEAARAVAGYLAECERYRLEPKYHPTLAGALKVIRCVGKGDSDLVRREFERQQARPHPTERGSQTDVPDTAGRQRELGEEFA